MKQHFEAPLHLIAAAMPAVMKSFMLFFALLPGCLPTHAQTQVNGWSIGLNPLGLAESQMSIGPAVAYHFSKRVQIWTEASFIFANAYMPDQWKAMKGFRFILQPRYYLGESREIFITPEFRMKRFSFQNTLSFINDANRDTLHNFPFRERQLLIGGAVVVGKRYRLLRNNTFGLEVTAGLGAKQRLIKRKNIPTGYRYDNYQKSAFALSPAYEEHNAGNVLFPLAARLVWKLN